MIIPSVWWARASRRRRLFVAFFFVKLLFSIVIFFPLILKGITKQAPSEHGRHPDCSCTILRNNFHPSERLDSSCSDELSQYSTNQNVISFAYFHPVRVTEYTHYYLNGIWENLKAMKELYPGFTMRLYTNTSPNMEQCSLLCENLDFQWCDIQRTPAYGNLSRIHPMIWRYLPMGDPTVNLFLVRDLDSILTQREVAAVDDWLKNTNKSIHVMRDDAWHAAPILGGSWGGSNERLWNALGVVSVENIRRKMLARGQRGRAKGMDQTILSRNIFFQHPALIVAHDSYFCRRYRQSLVRPFPVQRKDTSFDFVGNEAFGKAKYDIAKCPKECRPDYGKDWEYC